MTAGWHPSWHHPATARRKHISGRLGTCRTRSREPAHRLGNLPDITEGELEGHIEKGHMAAFGSHEHVGEFVGEKTVLNKLDFIVKIQNKVTKARMKLDAKENE